MIRRSVTQNIEAPEPRISSTACTWSPARSPECSAAGVVLGVGELLSLPIDPDSSPFYAVGSTTVDRTPAWAREFAIDTFGTNDKPALFIGMTIFIVLLAAIAGLSSGDAPVRQCHPGVLRAGWCVCGDPAPDAVDVCVPDAGRGRRRHRNLAGADRPPLGRRAPGVEDSWLPRRIFYCWPRRRRRDGRGSGSRRPVPRAETAGALANRDDFALPTCRDRAAADPAGTDIAIAGSRHVRHVERRLLSDRHRTAGPAVDDGSTGNCAFTAWSTARSR